MKMIYLFTKPRPRKICRKKCHCAELDQIRTWKKTSRKSVDGIKFFCSNYWQLEKQEKVKDGDEAKNSFLFSHLLLEEVGSLPKIRFNCDWKKISDHYLVKRKRFLFFIGGVSFIFHFLHVNNQEGFELKPRGYLGLLSLPILVSVV